NGTEGGCIGREGTDEAPGPGADEAHSHDGRLRPSPEREFPLGSGPRREQRQAVGSGRQGQRSSSPTTSLKSRSTRAGSRPSASATDPTTPPISTRTSGRKSTDCCVFPRILASNGSRSST